VVAHAERLRVHFAQAVKLASRIPIKSLAFPRTLSSLPAVREAILADLRT
jgi:hypothetical protein